MQPSPVHRKGGRELKLKKARWPSLEEVASTVVEVMNEKVPGMELYQGRQNGWPMKIQDITEQSQQRIHADARHLVTLIMLQHVCEEDEIERKRLSRSSLARMMGRGEGTVRHSVNIARHLMQLSEEFATVYTRSIEELQAAGFKLYGVYTKLHEGSRKP